MDAEQALTGFGFTPIESEIYHELLREAPLTAYRLAQKLGKAPANVYPPLKALLGKGAVLMSADHSEVSSYVPVAPGRLFDGMRESYLSRQQEALALLTRVHKPAPDAVVSQLRSVAQVLEHARSVLKSAKEVVLFDCMPPLHALLLDDFAALRERGVTVSGLVYEASASDPLTHTAQAAEGLEIRWPGYGLLLVVDACESVIALLSRDLDEVIHAIYSDSLFLNCLLHNLLTADIRMSALAHDPTHPETALSLLAMRPLGVRTMATQAASLAEDRATGGRPG